MEKYDALAMVGLAFMVVVPVLILMMGGRENYQDLGAVSTVIGIILLIASFIWRFSDEKKM